MTSKLGAWIMLAMGMGATPMTNAGSQFSGGEASQVSAHLDFQVTIQPSLKVQMALVGDRVRTQAETSPGSMLMRHTADQPFERFLPPSRRVPTRWSSDDSAPIAGTRPRIYTFVSP